MHRDSETALATTTSWSVNDWLSRAIVCLGCVVAGGTLVALALPTTRPAAGAANQGNSSDSVLLDFTSKTCGPCQQMIPIVDRLTEQGYPIRKVDVNRERDVAERFGITSIPTFVLLVNGREVMRKTGATEEAQLRRMVQQIPELERELAEQSRRRQPETKIADAGSGIAVDLGSAESTLGDARTLPPTKPPVEKSKPRFGIPFLQGKKDPAKVAAAGEAPVFRGQDPALDRTVPAKADGPMAASARLRVKDRTGSNVGSGTIISVQAGHALILTCGHIFRHLGQDGMVEVDLFDERRNPRVYAGKVVKFDLASDVGLVVIQTDEALATVPLANHDYKLTTGEKVVSIGCGGGELPSKEELAVTAINRYDGPENIECTGLPVQGRSGGGLFRGNMIVGVCIAADPDNRRGVYSALKPIHKLVEAAGDWHLFSDPPAVADTTLVETTPPMDMPKSVPLRNAPEHSPSAMTAAAESAGLISTPADSLRTAIEQSPDAEVIVIVRPKAPGAASRVVVVNQASSKLLSYLLDDIGGASTTTPPARDTALTRSEALIPTTVITPVAPRRPPINARQP